MRAVSKKVISETLHNLIETNEVIPVQFEENQTNSYYTFSKTLNETYRLGKSDKQVFLLSPFDNLIIQRDRIKRLFGFDYALECYLPAWKRKYGYFVLPVLWGDKFVGRFDAKADRSKKALIIGKLIFEPQFKIVDEFLHSFIHKLSEFAQFNECENIVLEKVTPKSIKTDLSHLINSIAK